VQGIGLITMPDTYMTSDGFEAAVTKLAASYQVIIIDTLKAASPGVDENDSKMRESLDRLRRVGERTGATFVVLIHSKKKSNSAVEIDARERGRGSSAIYDAADAQLGVEYEQGKPLKVLQTKARSGRYIDPFQVTIEDGEDGAVHVVAADAPKAATSALDDFENVVCVAVLEALRANPGASMRLLTEKSGKRYATVSAALEQLERNGAAKNTGSEKAARWFAT
jgi:predicted transcriptional regulator